MPLREDYFDKLNERSAYILGLIYSDGNLQFVKGVPRLVTIYSKDLILLEQISHELDEQGLKIRKGVGPLWYIRITNRKVCERLMELGVCHHKKEEWKEPQVPPRLMRHWMRGYFDGMGNVSWEKHMGTRYRIATAIFAHTYDGISFIQNWLVENGMTRARVHQSKTGRFHLRYKVDNSVKLISLLYHNATIFRSDVKEKVAYCFQRMQEAQPEDAEI